MVRVRVSVCKSLLCLLKWWTLDCVHRYTALYKLYSVCIASQLCVCIYTTNLYVAAWLSSSPSKKDRSPTNLPTYLFPKFGFNYDDRHIATNSLFINVQKLKTIIIRRFNSIQFYLYSAKLQQLSSQGTLNNMVQLKPIGVQFIVIII